MSKRHLKSNVLSFIFLFFLCFFLSSGSFPDASWAGGDSEEEGNVKIVSLQSVKELKQASKDYDFIYIILPAEDKTGDSILKTVLSATESADEKEKIGLFEVSRQTDGFKRFVRQHKVKKFPAVIAMNGSGKVETVQGEISQEKLKKAYSEVSGAKKKLRCPMSEGKPCDPKACGKDKGK